MTKIKTPTPLTMQLLILHTILGGILIFLGILDMTELTAKYGVALHAIIMCILAAILVVECTWLILVITQTIKEDNDK